MNTMPPIEPTPVTLAHLAGVPRWVAWQTEDRPDGKPTKVPYSPDGRKARANAPRTWGTRDKAEIQHLRLPKPYGLGGVGIEFGDLSNGLSIGGIDLDTCRDAEGTFTPWALEVIERFDTYAELSPSGTGAKLFFLYPTDTLPMVRTAMAGRDFGKQFKRGKGEHPPAIELHLGNRYFAVTDLHMGGTPAELRPVALDTLLWLIRDAGPAFVHKAPEEPLFEQVAEQPEEAPERDAAAGGTEAPEDSTEGHAEALELKEQVEAACKSHKELRKRWAGDWASLKDQSRSTKAFALMGALRRAGFGRDDAKGAIHLHRDTAEWAREKGDAAGGREFSRIWAALAEGEAKRETARAELGDFDANEDGIALAFAKRHADALRFDHDASAWYQWDDMIWRRDRTKLAFSWARILCRDMAGQGGDKDKLAKAGTSAAVERFAQSDRAFAVTSETWDGNDWLLGTPGGTVDLRTGEIRAARREDHITKATAVAPVAVPECRLWLKFLGEITGNDDGLIRFLRQWCGYCLTGDTREHALLFGAGDGGNGKGVFLNTVAGILGTYAVNAAMDTFTSSQHDRHSTDLAMLAGARMVIASETEQGRTWAEARIKALTGGDTITARFMRQDNFQFQPRFKLTIIGNHKPILKNVDEAARRRFNIVPFNYKPPKKDQALPTKLRKEWPEILRWMIEGCLDWQKNGLVRPKVVAEATEQYFESQDYFSRWLAEMCVLLPTASTKPSVLLHSFQQWCQVNGEEVSDNKGLRGMLERTPGLRYANVKGCQWVRGIGFKAPAKPDARVEGGG